MEADVSYVTMWKAFDSFKRDGTIARKRSASENPVASGETAGMPRQPKWRTVRNMLEREIAPGQIQRGSTIPSLNGYSVEYGVAYATLKRALESMVAEGTLVPFKKTYRIPLLNRSQATVSIDLILPGNAQGKLQIYDRILEAVQNIETECSIANVGLRKHALWPPDPTAFLDGFRPGADSLGQVIMSGNFSQIERNSLIAIACELGRHAPVAVFDEMGDFELPAAHPGRSGVRVFRMAARSAGKQVARLLTELGHTGRSLFFRSTITIYGRSTACVVCRSTLGDPVRKRS
jgi:hypothetical protein